jgi:hypothetical protein
LTPDGFHTLFDTRHHARIGVVRLRQIRLQANSHAAGIDGFLLSQPVMGVTEEWIGLTVLRIEFNRTFQKLYGEFQLPDWRCG